MKTKTLINTTLVIALSTVFSTSWAGADHAQGKRFTQGQTINMSDLPASAAKTRLQALSLPAQARALKWLESFTFHENDLANIHFDRDGGVFYADTKLPEATDTPEATTTPLSTSGTTTTDATLDTFKLHSKPGASKVIYLDFNGHIITGTAWNAGSTVEPSYNALPFSLDSDRSTFSSTERDMILQIWRRVAEDYAPFDVDVTTEEPSTFTSTTARVLITPSVDGNGKAMPQNTGGGVAYVGAFGLSNYSYYSPALVYSDRLLNTASYIAEASSHESGHNMGLSHDGRTSPVEEYYRGHGSGLVSWAPIMGDSYYNNLTQWSKGEYTYASSTQDDLAIISGKLGYRSDDHGNQFNNASFLFSAADGSINSTFPGDPNGSNHNKGIISSSSDVDMFTIEVGAGAINLTAKPAWAPYNLTSKRGANLDISMSLYDSNGNIIASSDPTTDTLANINATVDAGTYYVAVKGVGNSTTPYSDYASIGQYFISGSVVPSSNTISAPTAPSSLAASASSFSQIDMNWIDNANNEAGYYVYRSRDAVNWEVIATLTANSNSYSDTNLSESSRYYYQISAFNAAGENYSNNVATDTQAKPVAPNAPSNGSASNSIKGGAIINWIDNSNNEESFEVQRQTYNTKTKKWGSATIAGVADANQTSFINTALSRGVTYRYAIRAKNSIGTSAWSAWMQVTISQ